MKVAFVDSALFYVAVGVFVMAMVATEWTVAMYVALIYLMYITLRVRAFKETNH